MRTRMSIVRGVILSAALPAVVALGVLQIGCATTSDMQSASRVPASQGTVSATEGSSGNTNLAIRVKHLAIPSRIASDATVYVVWVQPRNSDPQNVGALALNDDLEGSLDTVTPHSQFLVSVTPESSGMAERPTHAPVFTYDVNRSN